MAIEVEGPDGVIIEFPDGTPEETMRRVMAQRYNKRPAQQQPKPTPRPTVARAARDSAAALGGSMFRGVAAFPDMLADAGEGVNRLFSGALATGGGALLRAAGANDAAQSFERAVAPPRQRGFRLGDVPDRLGTPRMMTGTGEFAGNVLGGMAIPSPTVSPVQKIQQTATATRQAARAIPAKPAAQAANTLADDAERAGVRLMRSDVRPPRTFVGKTAQATGERIVGTGTGAMRQAQQEQRIAAVRQLADDFNVTDDGAGIVNSVMDDLAKTRGAMISRMKDKKDAVIDGIDGMVPIDRTITTIDREIARLKGLKLPEMNAVISKLEGWKGAIQGQNLRNIEDIRKTMGSAFKAPELANVADEGQKAVNAIYAPMRAEMGTFIRNRAGESSYRQWQGANDKLSAMAGELKDKAFARIMNNAEVTPENVASMLFSTKPSQVQRLYANLSDAGKAKAQSAIIARAIEKAGGLDAISPEKFTTQIGKLGKSVGVFFQGDDLARVEGLNRVLQATRRASEASVAPPTGVQNAMAGLYGGSAVVGGVPGLLAVQGYGLLARVYESTGVRSALLRVAKTKAGSPAEAAAMQRAMQAISAAVAANRDLIAKAANDPVGMPIAADEGLTGTVTDDGTGYAAGNGQEYQQEQQPAFQP